MQNHMQPPQAYMNAHRGSNGSIGSNGSHKKLHFLGGADHGQGHGHKNGKNNVDAAHSKIKGAKAPVRKMPLTHQHSSNSDSSDHGVHELHSKAESNSDLNGHPSMDVEMMQKEAPVKPKKQKSQKPVKKVVVVNLPEDLQTIESVTQRCQKYGEILLVRVLKPGKVMPFDLQLYSGKIPDLGQTVCAIIEFETPQAAKETVEKEEGQLRLALLQQGAEVSLYGPREKAHSEHSAHTRGHESGISINRSSDMGPGSSLCNASSRDSLSNHSHDDMDQANDFLDDGHGSSPGHRHRRTRDSTSNIGSSASSEKSSAESTPKHNNFKPIFKQRIPLLSRPGKLETSRNQPIEIRLEDLKLNSQAHKQLTAELSTAETVKHVSAMNAPLKESHSITSNTTIRNTEEQNTASAEVKSNTSKVISTQNGRITTALNIKLTNNASGHVKTQTATGYNPSRLAIKLDLTEKRHPKLINARAMDLLPTDAKRVGRVSPGLLSDPSDEFLITNHQDYFSQQDYYQQEQYRQYSREHLFSLKDCKRALQLPNDLPNIPELIPTAKQTVLPTSPTGPNNRRESLFTLQGLGLPKPMPVLNYYNKFQ